MSTGPGNVADLAEELLAALVAQYTADGLVPPARRYVTFGEPVAECEALVVSFARLADASALEEKLRPANLGARTAATLVAWAWRCLDAVPEGEGEEVLEAPPAATLTADGRKVMTDAYVLRRGAIRATLAGSIRELGVGVQVGAVEPITPSGGVGGVRLPVQVDVF